MPAARAVLLRLACFVGVGIPGGLLTAEDDFERPPINYSAATPNNRVSRLQARLNDRSFQLSRESVHGYLPALLAALDVPVESQALVFSKTSLQLRRISPETPRAVYFTDDVYVGYCQFGDVLEISAVDPQLGAIFYTLDQQDAGGAPRLERRTDSCLVCHSSSRTEGVPGHLVRSLYVDPTGYPVLSGGSRNVDHRTPFAERWGGWYVTGEHGAQKHLGNLIVSERPDTTKVDNSAGQNLKTLAGRVNTDPYLSPHSDLVALMVLEHQVLVHNRITNASFTTRQALAYNDMMNEALKNEPATRLESTTRRIQNAGDKLVEALLFAGEAPLTEPVSGTSEFATQFAARGPCDASGRSLRELDLTRRMFRYPCSYLIYSESFAALPEEMRDYVWRRLDAVLSGADATTTFAHLTADDRQAIRDILSETMPNLPADWDRPDAPDVNAAASE